MWSISNVREDFRLILLEFTPDFNESDRASAEIQESLDYLQNLLEWSQEDEQEPLSR